MAGPCRKCLLLHQNLIYPAFLGATLVSVTTVLFNVGFENLLQVELVWAATALWFILYFVVAYGELLDTSSDKFGLWAFVANLVEVIVILIATIAVTNANPLGPSSQIQQDVQATLPEGSLNYSHIYLSWILIPVTAAASNLTSGRKVKTIPSAVALLAGVVGSMLELQDYYWSVLLAMYFALVVYLATILKGWESSLDIPPIPSSWFSCKVGA